MKPYRNDMQVEVDYRSVAELSPIALILVNDQGIIVYANRFSESIFGYSKEEMVGKKVEILIPGRFAENHIIHRSNYLFKPEPRKMGMGRDLFALKKNGEEFPVEVGLNVIDTEQGKHILTSLIDITDRKKNENLLKEHSKRIEEKNYELEHFASIVSHDLQEPLNTIQSFIELLAVNKEHNIHDNDEFYLEYIKQSADRMKNLILVLLEYSRLGNQDDKTAVSCNKLVSGVLKDLSNLIKETGSTIHVGELPELHASETELRVVFQNLITNAIKFSSKNQQKPIIEINAQMSDSHWQFSIKDNGIGIDPEHHDKIFIIFQRLNSRNDYDGMGIGLAHCRKIIERNKGKIWVDSKEGEGSIFHFTIENNHDTDDIHSITPIKS